MSRPNPNSTEQSSQKQPGEARYVIECCEVADTAVHELKELADDAGVRTGNFEFRRSDDSATDVPLLRVKGLEQSTAEDLLETLHKNGLMDVFDDTPIVTVLTPAS